MGDLGRIIPVSGLFVIVLAACNDGTTPIDSLPGGEAGGTAGATGNPSAGTAGGAVLAFGGTAGGGGSAGSFSDTCSSSAGFGIAGPPSNGIQPWRAAEAVTATACTTPPQGSAELPDVCACDDLTCPDGASCLLVWQPAPNAVGGPGSDFNGCFELCEADADCEAPAVCVGNLYGLKTCAQVACRSDADCNADPCGVCMPGYLIGHAGAIYSVPTASHCVYAGAR